jgi:exodeoxyribonuclease VII small subunit
MSNPIYKSPPAGDLGGEESFVMATKKMSFEEALAELERIIDQLERDDLTLTEALAHFERGVTLMRVCDTHLKNAEGKLTELTKGENGAFVEKILGATSESFATEDPDA